MHEGVLHIRDIQGTKKEGSEKARLAAVEQEIFKCQGMVECGLSDNYYMIMDFIHENNLDTKNVGEASSSVKIRLNAFKLESFTSKTKTMSMN
ncbi:40s ribosomal protein s5-1 [Hordeum vulgare]|nr:40s ribosomal protein s5-1 [Hordeum vulgare]